MIDVEEVSELSTSQAGPQLNVQNSLKYTKIVYNERERRFRT